jgi:N-acetylmuramoyl-L-alanine amidase
MKFKIFIFLTLILSFCGIYDSYSQTQDSLKTVVAQKGDGIYKILRDNGYSAKDYYHKFVELNKEKIKEDDSIILGETYYLPKNETIIPTPEKDSIKLPVRKNPDLLYADSVMTQLLKGTIIYLISGHGGPDPGAVAEVEENTLCEDEYAYDICLRIARAVEEQGGKAYMIVDDPDDGIREDKYLKVDYDEYCWPDLEIPRDQNLRLKQRADAVNDIYEDNKTVEYQRVIEIHLDSRGTTSTVDVFFYYYPASAKGKATAEVLQKVFSEKYAKYQPNRGYTGTVGERSLLVMKKVLPPEVFLELGNIQNEKDRKRFLDPDNRQAIAKWIVEGLIEEYTAK